MGLRKAAKKMVVAAAACASFTRKQALVEPSSAVVHHANLHISSPSPRKRDDDIVPAGKAEEAAAESTAKNVSSSKNICAICLDPLSYSTGSSPGKAIFTAQCSHAFHFACISSNVRHGSVTCPICRAQWTQLPRNLNPPFSAACGRADPILRILDDSIATFRVHRRSLLQSARYDDDDPLEPDDTYNYPRLDFSLMPSSHSYPNHFTGSSSLSRPICSSRRAYLSVKLSHHQATDFVLVASPNGPHLRLLKQAMAFVVFSLRPIDRLAIVTYSSAAARIFPLKRMTSYGKRAALQVIDRLFYAGHADPIEGFKKGVKVLEDRAHKNPHSSILLLSDNPTRTYRSMNTETPIPVHQFHVGFGYGASNGFVMHEFENFLARILGGAVREVQLRIGEEDAIVRLGELRGGEERRIMLDMCERDRVYVAYNYTEGGAGERIRTGETVVSVDDKAEIEGGDASLINGRRSSCVESWDYHDPSIARRWAKHLHGYRL